VKKLKVENNWKDFDEPCNMAVSIEGDLYVSDGRRIYKFDKSLEHDTSVDCINFEEQVAKLCGRRARAFCLFLIYQNEKIHIGTIMKNDLVLFDGENGNFKGKYPLNFDASKIT